MGKANKIKRKVRLACSDDHTHMLADYWHYLQCAIHDVFSCGALTPIDAPNLLCAQMSARGRSEKLTICVCALYCILLKIIQFYCFLCTLANNFHAQAHKLTKIVYLRSRLHNKGQTFQSGILLM